MKKICIIVVIAAILSLVFMSACTMAEADMTGNNEETSAEQASEENMIGTGFTTMDQPNEKLKVVTTIFPQYDFVRAIADDNVELTMLIPPGAESHSFEPTPQDIIRIQDCDLFIYVGGESDTWVDDILGTMDTSNMSIMAMTECVKTVEEEIVEGMEDDDESLDNGHDSDEDDGHEIDEHVWTSPKNAMLIVQAISRELQRLDSANEVLYRNETERYLAELETLNASFEEVTREAVRKTIVFGDRFPFRYFADEYGLQYYAAFPGCSSETESSAQTVAFLINKVTEEKIPVVFQIEFSNGQIADAICEVTGAKKLLLHSCHNVSLDDIANGVSYLSLMTQNVVNLKEALS